jgi:predicted NBD/HSP70 family sugar kinase
MDVGATKVLLGHQAGGTVQVTARLQTPSEPGALIRWLRGHLPVRVASLGMAFAGGIGADGRVTGWPNQPRWSGFPLREALSQFAGAVTIADDGTAAAVGEAWLGVARGRPDLLVAVFGTGLGGAVVLDHKVRLSAAGDPRTLGHLRIFSGGACACGGTGCAQRALRTLPSEDRLGKALEGWPDGLRLIGFLAGLARFLGASSVVLTGGLLQRPALRDQLATRLAAAGIEPLVPADPSASSLLGACVKADA